MSDAPRTIDEIVAWFAGRESHDEDELRDLVTRMLTTPYPSGDWMMHPALAWSTILEHGLLSKTMTHGWVTPEGKFYGAGYAAHERLLYWMGLEAADVEAAGWTRIGPHGFQSRYRLTGAQKRRVEKAGHAVDAEADRLKPVLPTPRPVLRRDETAVAAIDAAFALLDAEEDAFESALETLIEAYHRASATAHTRPKALMDVVEAIGEHVVDGPSIPTYLALRKAMVGAGYGERLPPDQSDYTDYGINEGDPEYGLE